MEPKAKVYLLSCVRIEMDEEAIGEKFVARQDCFLQFKENSLLDENSAK